MRIGNGIKKLDSFISRQFTTEKGLKNVAKIAVGMFLGGLIMEYGAYSEKKHLIYNIQKEVKKNGISQQDFDKLDSRFSPLSSREQVLSWHEALDSIKNQGKIEKAYLEGLQAARANQNK